MKRLLSLLCITSLLFLFGSCCCIPLSEPIPDDTIPSTVTTTSDTIVTTTAIRSSVTTTLSSTTLLTTSPPTTTIRPIATTSKPTTTTPKPTTTTSAPSAIGHGHATAVSPSALPAYSGSPFVILSDNIPNFSAEELTTVGYEQYSTLDSLGRCGTALASCGKEIMPKDDEKRGSISNIKPSGWVQAQYSGISGGYLWNRCHLIGWQLSAENANKNNLITGTRYMNVEGMLPFENMVADYIRETGNHVAYRVTPIFEGNNLVCSGVQIEAYSVEDQGDGICFNVYCYNVQPGITIYYATGNSTGPTTTKATTIKTTTRTANVTTTTQTIPATESDSALVWIPNSGSKYHSHSDCSNMKNPTQVTEEEAIAMGYEPCKRCY